MNVSVPARVWLDFLDPLATDMERELGLAERHADPFYVRRGKGGTFNYTSVPDDVVRELADYLYDRGDMLLGQGIDDAYDPMEKAMRDTLRRACRLAERLRVSLNTHTKETS